MDKKIKEARDKEINDFILKCLKKRPLSAKQLLDEIQKQRDEKGKPKFNINTLIGLRKDHLKYLEERRFLFRLDRKVPLESKKWKIKIPAQKFMEGYWFKWENGDQENYFHSYYFATPKTYFIKTKIFDEIIRALFLKGKEISKYIDHKKEIEELLSEAEKFMIWVEITPSIKKRYSHRNLYKSDNFSQFIIDYICEGKQIQRALFLITDFCLAPTLEKIEDFLSFGNSDYSYVNVYRILRKELYERKIFRLPEDYVKMEKKEEFYKKHFEENVKGKIFTKVLEKVHKESSKD